MSGIGYNVGDAIARVHAEIDAQQAERERAAAAERERIAADPILSTLDEHATLCGALIAMLRLRPGMCLDEMLSLMSRRGTVRHGPEQEDIDRRLLFQLLECMEQVRWVRAEIDRRLRLGQMAYFAR